LGGRGSTCRLIYHFTGETGAAKDIVYKRRF
jgi:hypothetical protein